MNGSAMTSVVRLSNLAFPKGIGRQLFITVSERDRSAGRRSVRIARSSLGDWMPAVAWNMSPISSVSKVRRVKVLGVASS